jgi:hypothetical protein
MYGSLCGWQHHSDSEYFKEIMSNYLCHRLQKVRPQRNMLGQCNAVKLVDVSKFVKSPIIYE